MDEATYKIFNITSNSGQSPRETILVILPSVLYIFLSNLISSLLCTRITLSKYLRFIIEFFFVVVPIIVNFCLPTLPVVATHLLLSISLLMSIRQLNNAIEPKYVENIRMKPYITNVRAVTNIMTVIAILAVDFDIFPRRFAKTEMYGFSLMDLGVGTYIFINGLVAPEARMIIEPITKTLRTVFVLLFLGVFRWFLTTRTQYNVPVNEYGVHWNFYITLALVKIFTRLILNVINVKFIVINAFLLIICHETLLETGLREYVFNETERISFLDANKEGVVSLLGYIAINLFTVYFSFNVNKYSKNRLKYVSFLLFLCSFSFVITYYLNIVFPISRRLANSTYCFWILGVGSFMTILFYIFELFVDKLCKTRLKHIIYCPIIFEAINYNGLAFFLIANVLTGIINVSYNTKSASNKMALFILVAYTFINCSIVCVLYWKKIRIRT